MLAGTYLFSPNELRIHIWYQRLIYNSSPQNHSKCTPQIPNCIEMETDSRFPLPKISDENRPTDFRFFSVFKNLMLNERIENLCAHPQRYKPFEFLSILKYIPSVEQKVAVLKQAHSTYPSHPKIIESLLGEYIHQEKWVDAALFAKSIAHLEDLRNRGSLFLKKCLVLSEHNKPFREFMLSHGYLEAPE